MKKVLSLVLALAMACSCGTVAFAAPADVTNEDQVKAVDTLTALGVVNGYEDGSYKPEKTVTRAEMAKLLVEALGYGDLVKGSTASFPDAKGLWYEGHVAIAEGLGILNGYPDGTVKGDYPVSYQEAVVMIVRALGYNDMGVNKAVDKYNATAYKTKASSIGILDDVIVKDGGATRGDIAIMLYNALDAKLVDVDADGKVTYILDPNEENEILLNKLATKADKDITPDYIDEEDHIADLTPYLGENCTVYLNDDDEVVYVKESNNDVKKGEVDYDKDKKTIKVDGKKFDESDVTTKTAFYVNFADASSDKTFADLDDKDVKIVYDEDNGNTILAIVYKDVTATKQVKSAYVEGKKYISATEGKVELPLDDDDDLDLDKLTLVGVDSLADLKENDVIEVYSPEDADDESDMTIVVTRETVDGKVRKVDGDTVTVNGTDYDLAELKDKAEAKLGCTYTFYLNEAGEIAFSDEEEGKESDYAYVTEIKDGFKSDSGVTLKDATIEVLTADGEIVKYVVNEDSGILKKDYAVDTDKVAEGDVIKFELNDDDEIDEITKVVKYDEIDKEKAPDLKPQSKSFIASSDLVIFSVADINDVDDDAEVVKLSALGETVDYGKYKYSTNEDGEIEVLVVEGLGAGEDTYAVITDVNKALNDDDDEVLAVTAYVNGEEKTYYTTKDNTISTTATAFEGKVFKLDFDGEDIKGVTEVSCTAKEAADVSGDRIKIGSTWYTLADDAVVYVYDGTTDFDYVGDISDIETAVDAGVGNGDDVIVIDTDEDTDNGYELVIVFAK